MTQRWLQLLQVSLPSVDIVDLMSSRDPNIRLNRQNMPEVAQATYMNTLAKECIIGDYVSVPDNSVRVTEEVRLYMVTVICEVHKLKGYKEETLYLACSLADRYLAALTLIEHPSPCLIRLGFVCILMAAKLEEPIQPSFNRMVRLVQQQWNFTTTKEELIEIESSVIYLLDCNLLFQGPVFFLERYQRILGVLSLIHI